MLYLIRHSERLSQVNREKWEKMARYKINNKDDPITKNGKIIATKTMTDMCNSGKITAENIEYIYSSPLSRCIETSLIFQKVIKQLLSIDVLIRVEYALVEITVNSNFYIKKNVIHVDNTINYLDDKLELENIYQKYGPSHFDTKYKPIVPFKKVDFDKTFEEGYNRAYSVFETFKKNTKSGKINILCTHGTFMNSIYSISINTVNMWNMSHKDYCVVLGYKNNVKKPVLGPIRFI
jgi:broad specificity phosphatase PhoE